MTNSKMRTKVLCCYCNEEVAITRDHVPPKAIFNKPRPGDLITVPACLKCNQGASVHDERFKVYLGMHVARFRGEGERLFKQSVLPSVNHNRDLKRKIIENMEHITMIGNDGNSLESGTAVLWDSEAHDSVIDRVTRGLYYHHVGSAVPKHASIDISWFKARPEVDPDILETKIIAGGAFIYHFAKLEESADSMWLYEFYGGHFAGAMIRDEDPVVEMDKSEQPPTSVPEHPPILISVTSPQSIDFYVEKLLNKMSAEYEPEIIPVKTEPYAKINSCFFNVEEKVKLDGGMVHYGWAIFKTPNIYEAERHAVWESPDGTLIDITPRPNYLSRIMFVSDNNFTYQGQLTDNVRINATKNPVVDDFILISEACTRFYMLGQRSGQFEIAIPNYVAPYIREYEKLKSIYQSYLHTGGNISSKCICQGPKNYKNCHGKIIKQKVQEDFKAIIALQKKLDHQS